MIHERNSAPSIAEQFYSSAIDLAEEPIRTLGLMNRGALRLKMKNVHAAISDFSQVIWLVHWLACMNLGVDPSDPNGQAIHEKTAGSMVFYNRGLCYFIDNKLDQVSKGCTAILVLRLVCCVHYI